MIIENAAFGDLSQGAVVLGAWEATLGGILLIGGLYVLGYQRALPRLQALTGQ
ncbi:MAG: hypothetical protein U5K37_12550 [Natrialbaceae archaeon]|nr:hypothetical protein [Natrialbaceae archaeon]